VGGSDFSQSQFNRAMLAKRQIGSSIKPLYFAHAFDQGFGLASQIDSPPIVLGDWKPDNYSGRFLGRQTLRSTVIHSYNVPSIQLFQALGSGAIAKHLGRLGLGIPEGDLSAALGSTGATLLEVVQAYTPFVRSGSVAELRLIDRVEDNQGKTLVDSLDRRLLPAPLLPLGAGKSPGGSVSVGLKAKADAGLESKETRDVLQVMTPEAAYLSFASLEDAVVFGTGNKARIQGVRVAGKTGTTNAYTDAWFIGMVPGLVGGVWVGFDDAKKSLGDGATGGHFAAPLWREVMVEAIKVLGQGQLDMPETIKLVGMDADTGALLEGESSGGQRVVVPAMEGYEPGSARLRHARGLLGDTPENEKPAGSEDRTPEQAPEEDTPNLRSLF
jgi:penicillin-binding protein 1A